MPDLLFGYSLDFQSDISFLFAIFFQTKQKKPIIVPDLSVYLITLQTKLQSVRYRETWNLDFLMPFFNIGYLRWAWAMSNCDHSVHASEVRVFLCTAHHWKLVYLDYMCWFAQNSLPYSKIRPNLLQYIGGNEGDWHGSSTRLLPGWTAIVWLGMTIPC